MSNTFGSVYQSQQGSRIELWSNRILLAGSLFNMSRMKAQHAMRNMFHQIFTFIPVELTSITLVDENAEHVFNSLQRRHTRLMDVSLSFKQHFLKIVTKARSSRVFILSNKLNLLVVTMIFFLHLFWQKHCL